MTGNLRRSWQRIRTVPGLGRDVTALAVVVVLGLAAGGYLLSHYGVNPPGTRTFTFAAEFEDAPGVAPANHQEVRIAGIKIGTITGAEPTGNRTARVTMTLDSGTTVFRNAKLVLRTKNPLNEMYVEVAPGGPPAEPLPPGGTIPVSQTQRPVQAYEVLDKLDARTRAALSSLLIASDTALAHAPQQLPAALNALNRNSADLTPVFDALQTRREKISQLVTALSQLSAAVGDNDTRLTSLLDSLQQTLTTLDTRGGDVNATLAQLPGFNDQLRDAMNATSSLTGQLNPTLDGLNRASGALPPALSKLSGTADQLGRTAQRAGPVVDAAGPVVHDLRPVVGDLQGALSSLAPVTRRLDAATARLVPWMNDLSAFVYNTSSVLSLSDANGTLARGQVTVDPNALPVIGGSK